MRQSEAERDRVRQTKAERDRVKQSKAEGGTDFVSEKVRART